MHQTAMNNAHRFFLNYRKFFNNKSCVKVLEIGSQDVNGSLRSVCPSEFEYLGVDFVPGKGVDLVLTDPYKLPFEANEYDIIISSSCFEHSEMFWVVFLEIMRVLNPRGLFYLNVPSNGQIHRYPLDCWRFYPDSGQALVSWAKRNAINAFLLESYISDQDSGVWNDFVAVFLKEEAFASEFSSRIIDDFSGFSNGRKNNNPEFLKPVEWPEDMKYHPLVTRLKL